MLLPLSNTRNTAGGSVASVASSSGDTASVVPHWLLQQGGQHRTSVVTTASDSSSIMSAVSRMKNIQNSNNPLPFREVAPVKPVEQHATRANHSSEGNRVVGPPRTWRKLAVAAQKQDMKQQSQSSSMNGSTTKENSMTGGDFHNRAVSPTQQRFLYDRSNLQ